MNPAVGVMRCRWRTRPLGAGRDGKQPVSLAARPRWPTGGVISTAGSTGPRTAEGRERCLAAPWKHGARARDVRDAARDCTDCNTDRG